MPVNYLGVDLINLEKTEEKDVISFKLFDSEQKNSILIDYIPKVDDEYNYTDFEVILLENNYLNAENDVFQVCDKVSNKRIGWIFPLSNLESNENDYAENEHLNKYKYVAIQLLLIASGRAIKIESDNNEFTISDLYPDNPILLILSKNQVSKIDNFIFNDYIPSLSKFGYYLQNDHKNEVALKSKKDFCLKSRGKKKIRLTKAKINIHKHQFFDDLFTQHLKTLEHHLLRFHLLYQIIEYTLNERFDNEFTNLMDKYKSSQIVKNDFIELINNAKKERLNIRQVIKDLKELPCDFNTTDLERDCKALLEIHKRVIKHSLGDLIYDVRNLLTHSYRSIKESDFDVIDNIIHELELLTINIFENYTINQTQNNK